MRYERPTIVARERIAALLDSTSKSDPQNDGTTPSDVHIKEHIHPVTWGEPVETVDYAKPEIVTRERITALLDSTSPSDPQQPDTGISDVRRKAHIHAVVWGEAAETVDYAKPEIVARERIAALLGSSSKSDPQQPDADSDVHIKEHIHPVTWGEPAETVHYAKPAIDAREPLTGLLIDSSSETRDAQP